MKLMVFAGITAGLALSGSAHAATFIVDALGNSSSGGVGLDTVLLDTGDIFTISADSDDLWSAGALPRYSDADGLTYNRFATADDDSGQPVGTLIGIDFGLWTQHSLSAAYGSLVGELGGVYKVLGTSFSGAAWADGPLRLYYWDSNNADNTGDISVAVGLVPEPAAWSLMIMGFGLAGGLLRLRRRQVAFAR